MVAVVGGFILLTVLFQDVRTPNAVIWEPVTVGEQPMDRASGLLIQQESDGVLWASDGFSIYRSEDSRGFLKIHEVRPPFGMMWAAYSRTLRRVLGYQEVVEVVPLRRDLLLVFVGGEIHRVDLGEGTTEVVHRLRYFGRGEGRGVMPFGIAVDDDGRVYYGEYVTRPLEDGETIALFRSDDNGRSFKIVYEFPDLVVRHIHNVQWDPFDKVVWMGTGDGDEQSRVGYSKDLGRSFLWVGQGSQDFRTTAFVFTEASVDWLSDTRTVPAKAVRWHRDNWEIQTSEKSLPSHGLYLQNLEGGYRLGTTAEDTAGLWLVDPDLDLTSIIQWPVQETLARGFPTVRLARGISEGNDWAFFSPLRISGEETAIYRYQKASLFASAGVPYPLNGPLLSRDDR
jgi:hypothetical protein